MSGIIKEMRLVVARIVGDYDKACAVVYTLLKRFGGQNIYIPFDDYQTRNNEIKELYKTGLGIENIAKKYQLHKKTIYRIVKNAK